MSISQDVQSFENTIKNIGSEAIILENQFKDLETKLRKAVSALADIGFSEDMTDEQRKHKAQRIYKELEPEE